MALNKGFEGFFNPNKVGFDGGLFRRQFFPLLAFRIRS
ncbi:MAG: hypothetical protein ACJAYJ_001687 [Saprospiraceae bacterium]|jgi:hypothetical protein